MTTLRRLSIPTLALALSAAAAASFAADEPPPTPGNRPAPEQLFRRFDTDGDGKLSRAEFDKFVEIAPRLRANPQVAGQLFARMDRDGDGSLSAAEFAGGLAALGRPGGDGNPPANRPFQRRPGAPGAPAAPVAPGAPAAVADAKPTADQLAYFEKSVRPVLVQNCYECHSADAKKIKGGLTLDTREGIRKGGDTGPAVVPGNLEKSLLVKAIRWHDDELKMPPKVKLPDAAIGDLEQWIKTGAADPRDGKPAVAKVEIDIAKGKQFWAFQPPAKPAVPAVKDAEWPRTDVDRFLLAAMEAKGVKPVGDADRAALLRRLSFDLIGLPPTPEEVEAFLADTSATAVEKVVDRLLASPAFGERWGRHWLDVARFAESSGKQVNIAYPHAWRYRDYVVDSFNADKPFDLFVKEQVAGDLMPAKDDKQRAERLVATGFLAVGSKQHNERNRLQFELDLVDEQIDTVSQAVLGMTVACARCHDHKFDPIAQRDYYALAGVFRSTDTLFGTARVIQNNQTTELLELPKGAAAPVAVPKLTPEERAQIESQIADLKTQRQELFAKGREALQGNVQILFIQSRLGLLEARLATYEPDGTPRALAMGTRDRRRPTDSPLYARGEPTQPGQLVPRGIPQVLTSGSGAIATRGSGRLELAEFVGSTSNPLTARVYVNRVWLHLFGQGIVPTPDNFGASGTPPTNQALLDHLAVTFATEGWSTKKLVRRLVLSRAYQLATVHDERSHEVDPENTLVWRAGSRRLDAEGIRDAILAVAGSLNGTRPTGSPVARNGDGPAQALQRPAFGRFGGGRGSPAEDAHRSVYLPIVRDQLPEALATFDFAEPSMVTGQRAQTSVPSQALYLLNSPFVINAADAAATKLRREVPDESARVTRAYLAVYNRPPTAAEAEAATDFLDRYSATVGSAASPSPAARHDAWVALVQSLMGSAEFLYLN